MAAIANVDRSAQGYGGYKYQWARHVLRESLKYDVQQVKDNLAKATAVPAASEITPDGIPRNAAGLKLRDIAKATEHTTFGSPPETPGHFNMGIIGSGVGGMFTALLIDYLNTKFSSKIKIDYDIIEAGGKKRGIGGRLYTHRFDDDKTGAKHQYYDVGSMRFPDNETMARTFKLFKLLGITKEGTETPRLIRYYMYDKEKDSEKVLPKYYNDVRHFGKVDWEKGDPFKVNTYVDPKDKDRIPDNILHQDPSDVVANAIKPIVTLLQKDMDSLAASGDASPGWSALMAADFLTTREFLRYKGAIPGTTLGKDEKGNNIPLEGLGYNYNTIEYLESLDLATGWYDQAFSETILESLDFDPPAGQEPSNDYWWCIEGGTQLLAERLASKLKNQPQLNKQVTAIETDLKTGAITLTTRTTAPDGWSKEDEFPSKTAESKYFTVFNSTTLGAMQRMDLSKANLLWGTKQAIRSLRYGASCKVGMQFSEMWWMQEPLYIKEGGLGKTDLPLRVCVYPSYNVGDAADKPGVLLCSYSWAQDAQRIGSLIDPRSPKDEQELKELMLTNLARLHANPEKGWSYERTLERIRKLYITHHAYDWYHDPSAGGFGYFGPGQFSNMWPQIIKPSGWLFLIGEAASAHHGWIVGALESAVRAVFQLFVMLEQQRADHKIEFDGYREVIEFLRGPEKHTDPDWELPFVGLPRELPVRQQGTEKGDETQIVPVKNVDLEFVAAQVIASFYELIFEVAREAGKAAETQTTSNSGGITV